MKLIVCALFAIGASLTAKADLVQNAYYLYSINPEDGRMIPVTNNGVAIQTSESEILSSNLVRYQYNLYSVSTADGRMKLVTKNGVVINAKEVTIP